MARIDKLKDETEKLRVWLKFWLNIIIAIFIGFSSVIYAYIINKITMGATITLLLSLLTIFLFIAKIVMSMRENQSVLSDEIGDTQC